MKDDLTYHSLLTSYPTRMDVILLSYLEFFKSIVVNENADRNWSIARHFAGDATLSWCPITVPTIVILRTSSIHN